MSRVLLVCPEPVGHGQPAGIGIRFIEIARVLVSDGHAVTFMSRDGGSVEGCRAVALSPQTIAMETASADVAVVQGHAANELFAHGAELPTVVDLYDPFIIENLHYYAERGAEVFAHDHATVVLSLLRGDFFLCASEAQRLFYLGMLTATGRVNPALFEGDPSFSSLVEIAPFGVGEPRAWPARNSSSILFGGIYDWYDPVLAIEAVAMARREIADLTLTFTRHPNPELTPQGKLAEAIAHVERRGYRDFIRFEPWFAYDRRSEFFSRFRMALLTFPRSIETDLSMRTRVFDYLWAGLPIVTSVAPGTDVLIERYGAGTVIDSHAAQDYASAIVTILRDEELLRTMTRGTDAFARDHQWDRTLQPLRAFCAQPAVDRTKRDFAAALHLPDRPPSLFARIRRRIGGRS